MKTDAQKARQLRFELMASLTFYTLCLGIMAAVVLGVIALASAVL